MSGVGLWSRTFCDDAAVRSSSGRRQAVGPLELACHVALVSKATSAATCASDCHSDRGLPSARRASVPVGARPERPAEVARMVSGRCPRSLEIGGRRLLARVSGEYPHELDCPEVILARAERRR